MSEAPAEGYMKFLVWGGVMYRADVVGSLPIMLHIVMATHDLPIASARLQNHTYDCVASAADEMIWAASILVLPLAQRHPFWAYSNVSCCNGFD